MDDLSYSYFREPLVWNNKLLGVNDNAAAGNYDNDLDDMGIIQGNLSSTWNYNYDEIGNLVLDKQEYIDNIEWTAYGKVKKVIKNKALKQKDVDRDGVVDAEDDLNTDGIADEIVLQDLEFMYDATGNRICKIVKPHLRSTDTGFPGLTSQDQWTYTYYVRDADGNVMATYDRSFRHLTGTNYNDVFDLGELDIYGSSRVGIVKDADVQLTRAFTAAIGSDNMFGSVSYASVTPPTSCTTCPRSYSRTLGHKQYELGNHLGNVIATVSDKKLMIQDATILTAVDHYIPDVLSANDYYAFGLNMPGRSFSGDGYRYGFNGKEEDTEWDGGGSMYDYGFRIYNPRLGKFLSVDPLSPKYPELTPYQFASNTPIQAIDLDGLESTPAGKCPYHGKTTKLQNGVVWVEGAEFDKYIQTSKENSKIGLGTPLPGDSWLWSLGVNFGNSVIRGLGYLSEIPGQMHYGAKVAPENQSKVFPLTHGKNLTHLITDPIAAPIIAIGNVIQNPLSPEAWADMLAMAAIYSVTKGSSAPKSAVLFEKFEGGATYASVEGQAIGMYKYSEARGLEFDINIPSNLQNQGYGTLIFEHGIKSTNTTKFTAVWIESEMYDTGSSVNLQRYNTALKTMSPEQAAFQTWSGRQAAAHGFKNVTIKNLPNGVEATFTK